MNPAHYPSLVARFVARGAIRLNDRGFEKPMDEKSVKYHAQAEANRAQGLTHDGKPLRVNRHPELKGLIGKDYHRAHMRIWRRGGARKRL